MALQGSALQVVAQGSKVLVFSRRLGSPGHTGLPGHTGFPGKSVEGHLPAMKCFVSEAISAHGSACAPCVFCACARMFNSSFMRAQTEII